MSGTPDDAIVAAAKATIQTIDADVFHLEQKIAVLQAKVDRLKAKRWNAQARVMEVEGRRRQAYLAGMSGGPE